MLFEQRGVPVVLSSLFKPITCLCFSSLLLWVQGNTQRLMVRRSSRWA